MHKNIQVRLNVTVYNVIKDNKTEFVDPTLRDFYENTGFSHQTSIARTPQQNDVVERQNRTLMEAACTIEDLGKPNAKADIVPVAVAPRGVKISDSPVFTYIDQDTPSSIPTMTCHPPIRPAATCTVPRIQLLAASRRHVAASYWTAASDVAPTSAPVSAGYDGQRRRSTTVNGGGSRWSGPGLVWVWIGSGPGPPRGMPRVSHVCTRGIHVDADVDNMPFVGVDPGTLMLESLGKPRDQLR
nr:integrase, catalytic region, zinc finger, CCHC-type, peptidase aspartic, catalytic [Tanacetum cinerariifolium]